MIFDPENDLVWYCSMDHPVYKAIHNLNLVQDLVEIHEEKSYYKSLLEIHLDLEKINAMSLCQVDVGPKFNEDFIESIESSEVTECDGDYSYI